VSTARAGGDPAADAIRLRVVPPDERLAKGIDRCETHPGVASVAECDRCRRQLCVECAVPVRGRVLGPECLSAVLGDEAAWWSARAPQRPRRPGMRAVGGAFAVLALLTIPAWTRFGRASGPLDAWSWPRWSLLAASLAVAGLAAWALHWWRPRRSDRSIAAVLTWAGGLTATAAALAAALPPPLTRSTPVPSIAVAVGLVAAAIAARASRLGRPRPG
jgi:hypothetical protein